MNRVLLLLTLTIMLACNNIPADKRLKNTNDSSFRKPVVVIDFTGVDCSNCPRAAKILKDMHAIAGDKIISVAMYPDCNFNHNSFDLRCPEATQYYEAFGDIQKISLPSGMVDFTTYNNQLILYADLWQSAVAQRITQDIPINIELKATDNTMNGLERALTITFKITSEKEIEGNHSLILWLLENNIIGYQNVFGVPSHDYEHNHVLRTAINGLWGENITIPIGSWVEKSVVYKPANSNWKLENCYVVGIIINTNTKEIITAVETKVSNI